MRGEIEDKGYVHVLAVGRPMDERDNAGRPTWRKSAMKKPQKQSHIIVLGGVKYYYNELMEQYKLRPFEVDLDTISDDSMFIHDLAASLASGWDPTLPLRISIPAEPRLPNAEELQGHILDGRHRVWAWGMRYDSGLNAPPPVIEKVPVTSIDNILCLRAHYEMRYRSKSGEVGRRHITKLLLGRLEVHPELTSLEKAKAFFEKNGFATEEEIQRIYTKFQVKKNPALRRNRPNRPGVSSVMSPTLRKAIEYQQTLPVLDDAASIRLVCPACKEDLLCPKCQGSYAMLIADDNKTGYKTQLKKLMNVAVGEAKKD